MHAIQLTDRYLMRALNRSRIRDWRGSKIGKCPPNVREDALHAVRENDFPLAGRSFSQGSMDRPIGDKIHYSALGRL